RPQPAEPAVLAEARGQLDAQVLERGHAVVYRGAEPQQPVLVGLTVELVPFETGVTQPVLSDRRAGHGGIGHTPIPTAVRLCLPNTALNSSHPPTPSRARPGCVRSISAFSLANVSWTS